MSRNQTIIWLQRFKIIASNLTNSPQMIEIMKIYPIIKSRRNLSEFSSALVNSRKKNVFNGYLSFSKRYHNGIEWLKINKRTNTKERKKKTQISRQHPMMTNRNRWVMSFGNKIFEIKSSAYAKAGEISCCYCCFCLLQRYGLVVEF